MEIESAMVRIPPAMLAQLDVLQAEVQADPELYALIADRTGKVTRSGLVRLCLSRGMASVRGALRARGTEESKPTPKPTPKPARKPAKKTGRRRK